MMNDDAAEVRKRLAIAEAELAALNDFRAMVERKRQQFKKTE